MDKNVRTFLVTGCGSIGRRHIENLLHLGVHKVLAQDPEADRREYVRNTFQIDCFADYEEALSKGVDTVFICNPTSLHVSAAAAALRSNCDVFIEKPLSDSAQGLAELLELSKVCGRLVFVACNFRFEKGLQQVHALLRENRIGRVFSATAEFGHFLPDWRPWQDYRKSYSASKHLGGGVLLDSYHEFDFLDWLLGPVDQVFCIERKTGLLEIDTEDMAFVTLSFAQGALGQVHLDYLRKPYTRRFELIGELGTLQWDFGNQKMRRYDAVQDCWTSYETDGKANANQMYVEEVRHFLACLEGRERPVCTLEDAIRIQSNIFAAMDSAHSGKAFRLREMSYSSSPAAG